MKKIVGGKEFSEQLIFTVLAVLEIHSKLKIYSFGNIYKKTRGPVKPGT